MPARTISRLASLRALLLALGTAVSLVASLPAQAQQASASASPSAQPASKAGAQIAPGLGAVEARKIAKDAYVYGFPMVDNYRILHSYFVDKANPEFKAPWNELHNTARVFTPQDKAIQTPNSDTPYSQLGLDLRTEPMVLTVPAVEKNRYYSIQLIDLYTFNFAYIGSRATGNGAGSYLVAGPHWKGSKPAGIKAVIRSETELALALYRTQLLDAKDIDKVKAVQAGYKAQPLSQFLGTAAPAPAPAVDFIAPLGAQEERTSPAFFRQLNFLLQFVAPDPSEKALMARFARLGIGAGKDFDVQALPANLQKAVQDGIADAWKAFGDHKVRDLDTGKQSSADGFGTRAFLKNNYMNRMSGAVLGIYGNSKEEAIYPVYFVDANKQKLDGKHRYTLRFAPGQLPPVNAFWSLTMYELPASLLYDNPLNRYLVNSPMLRTLKRDADGGITLYLQHDSPGAGKASNWLPAPAGPFLPVMRLYWPKPAALSGQWKAPPLRRTD